MGGISLDHCEGLFMLAVLGMLSAADYPVYAGYGLILGIYLS
jgi:hypothetical protein